MVTSPLIFLVYMPEENSRKMLTRALNPNYGFLCHGKASARKPVHFLIS